MKYCCECKEAKTLDFFHKSRKHKAGLAPRCIPCAIKVASQWYAANKDRKREYDAIRRLQKRHLYRQASKRFRDASPGRKNADTQARRAALAKRIPPWIKASECVAFYESAERVSKCLGIKHVVDHVIPLRGKMVSGLHAPMNLQVIPEVLNLKKHNHYSITPDGKRA
jgi:hypothetical protein